MYSLAMERAKERLRAQANRTIAVTLKSLALMWLEERPWIGRDQRVRNMTCLIEIDALDAKAVRLARRYRQMLPHLEAWRINSERRYENS
jgi:hypothetical protein